MSFIELALAPRPRASFGVEGVAWRAGRIAGARHSSNDYALTKTMEIGHA